MEAVKQATTTYAGYSYLGLDRTVKVAYGEPGIDLTFIGSSGGAGDKYVGLDRFAKGVTH